MFFYGVFGKPSNNIGVVVRDPGGALFRELTSAIAQKKPLFMNSTDKPSPFPKRTNAVARADVYKCVDTERDYQDLKHGDRGSSNTRGDGGRTLDEFALYILVYAQKLAAYSGEFNSPHAKLDMVRKVAGLCVNAMEQHGTVDRQVPFSASPMD